MHACTFISGDDDFLVSRKGQEAFAEAAEGCEDEFGREIIDGMALTVDEVANTIANTIQATQTLSLFGGRKAVWLRGANFLSDKRPGNTEGAKAEVEKLLACIEGLHAESVSLVITACPVDRRRREFKQLQKLSRAVDIKADANNVQPFIESSCSELGLRIEHEATLALAEKVGSSTRLMLNELEKLATYLADEPTPTITLGHVTELVPNFGEGNHFETTEAFYALDLKWTLEALNRHFFVHKEARPLLAGLQSANRVLVQLRALLDAGALRVGARGIAKSELESAAQRFGDYYDDSGTKSAFNVFTQNPFYLGKLARSAQRLSLRQLIRFEQALLEAFEGILERPNEQHAVMNTLAIKCLS